MYCWNCGKEIDNKAVICVHCGVATDSGIKEKPVDKIDNNLTVISVLIPIVGIILGIAKLCQDQKKAGEHYLCTAIIASIVWSAIFFGIYFLLTEL